MTFPFAPTAHLEEPQTKNPRYCTLPPISVAPCALHESDINTRTPMKASTECLRRHAQVQVPTTTANDKLLLEFAFKSAADYPLDTG